MNLKLHQVSWKDWNTENQAMHIGSIDHGSLSSLEATAFALDVYAAIRPLFKSDDA